VKRSEALVIVAVMALAFGAGGWIRGSQPPASAEQGAELRALLGSQELEMISSTTCRYCTKARAWLTEQRVPFRECFIEKDAACMQRYVQTGARATPTFVVNDKAAVLGLDVPRIAQLLQAQ
jgi:glutaredoxin